MLHARHEAVIRMGPLSIFTLVIALCLAVVAVLAVSAGNASLVMTERQAESVAQLYLGEEAAEEFVAQLDARLANVRAAGDAGASLQAVEEGLSASIAAAESSVGGQVSASASLDGRLVRAEFSCQNGRTLFLEVRVLDDARLRIEAWKMATMRNEAEPAGQLLVLEDA